ncbi:MAG TPA: LysR family transcriptional regulator [Vicinamibacterales bacterium]|nr:LysR family transcriptional regulator [Vicinamibacterales bacterium]
MIHDLRLIRAFLALARAGSFTRAASELHMSQPTLTVQIQQLETWLGVKLFDRNKRHVALTQAGRDLLVPLERILIDVEAIATNAEELLEHRRGLVTVAALPSVAAGLLPRAIKKLTEEYPGITVRVYDGVASTVAAMVRSGQVDFGISSQTYGDRELTSHVLMMDRLCAVVASNHPLARKRSMTLHELAKHPLILMVKDSSSRQIVDLAFDREGLVGNVAYETTYGTSVAGFTQAGLGIGILPESMAAPSRLHQLRIRGEKLTRRIGIVMRAGRSLSPTADRLKRTLESVAGARVGTPLAGNPVAKTSMTKGRGRD